MGQVHELYLDLEPVCKCSCPIREHMYSEDGVCACGCPEFRRAGGHEAIHGDSSV